MNHYDILGLDLELENGKVEGKVTGTLSKYLQDYFNFYLTQLNKNKVLAVKNGGNVYTLFLPPIPGKAAIEDITRKLLRKAFKRTVPSTCTLSTINTCQADCLHCSAAQSMKQTKKALSNEEFKNVIDQAIELGVVNITLTGGEPLLRKDLFELIHYVDKEKTICPMFTNGEFLTEANVKKLDEAGIFSVMVSLDSPDAKEHDEMRRRPGLFNKAIEGIKRMLDRGMLVGISTYASQENIADGKLEKLLYLGKDLKVHELVIFDAVPTGRFIDKKDCMLTDSDREKIRKITEEWRTNPDLPNITAMSWVNSPQGSGCFGANEQFYMTAWGDITPCDFTPLAFGNIREESLQTIWMRMLSHPAYSTPHQKCRMQDPDFRKQYIDCMPAGADLPIELWKDENAFKESDNGFKPSDSAKKSSIPLTIRTSGF
ncbi:MAG TPA: radical SAM protein [Nitrospinota bacterium]|nr:radical SAM protein [Nitrospinota bacterium]